MKAKHLKFKNRAHPDADAPELLSSGSLRRRSSGETKLNLLAFLVLFIGIFLGWAFISPWSALDSLETAKEQPQSAASDHGTTLLTAKEPDTSTMEVRNEERSPLASQETVALEDRPGEPQPQGSANVSPTPLASTIGVVEAAQVDRPAPAFLDDGETEGLAISGRVQDEEGQPLAGIEVLAKATRLFDADEEADEKATDSAREEVLSSVTGYDGAFEFQGLADGEYRVHTAAMYGFAPAQISVRAGATSANLVLAWQREVRVFGVVRNTAGAPLEAVRVIPPGRVTYSGPKGHYEATFMVKKGDQSHTLLFKREGYRDEPMQLDLDDLDGAFDDVLLDVSMEPLEGLTTVTGTLKDPSGHPLTGEDLHLQSLRLKTQYRAKSDINGRFFFDGVQPGEDYRIRVFPKADYQDYKKQAFEVPRSGLNLEVVLQPLGLGRISGWMVDADDNPIPGFTLTLRSEADIHRSVQVTGDDDGFFEVEGIAEGSVKLRTESFPIITIAGIHASSKAEEPVLVVLDQGRHELRGRVTNRRGEPVAARDVTLAWWHKGAGVRSFSSRRTPADGNGDFAFTGIGPGLHTLRVSAPGFSTAEIELSVGLDNGEILVQLDEES